MKTRIGIIGLGMISGKHISEMTAAGGTVTAICDIDQDLLMKTGDRLNIDEKHRFTDYNELINCDEVDAVEICVPNYLHVDMSLAAADAGKPFNVEKPLSIDYEHTVPLVEKLKTNPVPNMVSFSYRFVPAARYAKWILENKLIGDILSINAQYFKSSFILFKEQPITWRSVKALAGTGVLGDLGVHLIDMTLFLVGSINRVCGRTEVSIKERIIPGTGEIQRVETDDYCSFLADIQDGINGNFVISRVAAGSNNDIKYDIRGTNGSISIDTNKPNVLQVCIGDFDIKSSEMHEVKVPNEFKMTQGEAFFALINGKKDKNLPTVQTGVECQKVLDAILVSSEESRWVNV